jgi:transglutaminase-like putative cysteine protease
MSIQVAIHHRTEYHFDRSVNLSPHIIRLRPSPHTRTPVHHYSLKIEPDKKFLNWQQDPFGNFMARVVFPEPTKKLVIDVSLIVELVKINPFDFFLEDNAKFFPIKYPTQLEKELAPYFQVSEKGERLTEWVKKHKTGKKPIIDFLVELN